MSRYEERLQRDLSNLKVHLGNLVQDVEVLSSEVFLVGTMTIRRYDVVSIGYYSIRIIRCSIWRVRRGFGERRDASAFYGDQRGVQRDGAVRLLRHLF